jgi:hypothetical protein
VCPQAATGEDVTPNELGGAELHCTTSGVSDHLAESEAHAVSIARSIVSNLPPPGAPAGGAWPRAAWQEPLHPPEDLRGLRGAPWSRISLHSGAIGKNIMACHTSAKQSVHCGCTPFPADERVTCREH